VADSVEMSAEDTPGRVEGEGEGTTPEAYDIPEKKTPEGGAIAEEKEEGTRNILIIVGLTCMACPAAMIVLGIQIIMPMFISAAVDQPAVVLALIQFLGLFLQLLGTFASYFSDRCTSRFGRRRPFIFAGALFFLLGTILFIIGYHYEQPWVFAAGFWVISLAGGVITQALSALATELTAKSRLGLVGGFMGLWGGLGGFSGLLLVLFVQDRLIMGGVFVVVTILTVGIVLVTGKEKPLSPSSDILLPLKRAKTTGEKVWFAIKDFVSSYTFSVRRFPDFFLFLVYRSLASFASSANYAQYFLNDIMFVPNVTEVSAYMSLITLGCTFLTSPIIGILNDCHKRPRLTMVASAVLLLFCGSIFIWAKEPYIPIYIGSVVGGLGASTYASSSMPVAVNVFPTREKTAQFFALINMFELFFAALGNPVFGPILEQFAVPQEPHSSFSSSLSLSSFSLSSFSSSSNKLQPPMYTLTGYIVVYGISCAISFFSAIVLLFINTGRGRKAQEEYKIECEKDAEVNERLLPIAAEDDNTADIPIKKAMVVNDPPDIAED